jgi:CRISPR-associated protein Cas2
MGRSFYVLAYDIAEDRRRQKIAKLCESVAERVQGSVFEGYFTEDELQKLLKQVKRVFEMEEDRLRIYVLCASCREKSETHGQGSVTPPPGVIIV